MAFWLSDNSKLGKCMCLTDIFVFPLLQNCMIDRYLQSVSRHAHVGHLRLSAVNVWDAFCVLFRTFIFEKVHIVFCSIHEMHFMIFGFCSVAHCMRMSHGNFSFFLFYKTVRSIGICSR